MSFSDLPLKLGIFMGGFAGVIGIILMIYTIISRAADTPSGYATIICVLCFMFAFLFLIVGIIGEYIAILFKEIKDRPIYIINTTRNLEKK
ncbi:putative glycosyltransferase [bioreactor metagenome]|uniref:Putative glycosyltransferase n=1 Tax=bioreactor metagenome TaxID=1076179 RepID=A0A645H7S7_9ZZZZ